MTEGKVHSIKVAKEITGPDDVSSIPKHWAIFCPACNCLHVFDSRWTFNGNQEKPTFKPSMLINKDLKEPNVVSENYTSHKCHSFVTDGKIQFLGDCTHEMAGKTVDLEDY